MRNDYYDIDLDDFPDKINNYFLIYNLTKAGVLGDVRLSCSQSNFHARRLKEYYFGLHDEKYDSLTEWKEVSTVTSVIWEFFWAGKECMRKVAEAGDWFAFDEVALCDFLLNSEVGR